jgi:hypothetical protein
VGDLPARDRLILWTYGGVGLLVAGSWLIQRDWIGGIYPGVGPVLRAGGHFYTRAGLRAWWPGFGAQMGWILTAALGLLLLVEWRLAYGKGFRWFLWTACLTLAAGGLLGLRMDPSGLVRYCHSILYWTLWDERWGGRFGWSSALILTLLFLGLWALVPRRASKPWLILVSTRFYFALPVLPSWGCTGCAGWRSARGER